VTAEPLTAGPQPVRMLGVTAAWGACFIFIRWGLGDAPVLWFAALRALAAGAALAALAVVQRRPMPRGRSAWALITLLGITNASVAFAVMFAGVAGLATGSAAVLANAQPLLILLPAWWLYRERVAGRLVFAVVVGFAGLLVVAVPGGGGQGAALSMVAAVAITAGTLLARRAGQLDVVAVAGWHLLIGGAVLAAVAGVVEGVPAINWTLRFEVSLAFLSLVGTAAAYVVWFQEAQRCALGRLAAWTFLVPVFGITLGLVVLDERPGWWTVAGLSLVLGSMWLALHPKSSERSWPATIATHR
jgi:probable blue pigment (indigoidine) exporter